MRRRSFHPIYNSHQILFTSLSLLLLISTYSLSISVATPYVLRPTPHIGSTQSIHFILPITDSQDALPDTLPIARVNQSPKGHAQEDSLVLSLKFGNYHNGSGLWTGKD